jgi:hypothetical protein
MHVKVDEELCGFSKDALTKGNLLILSLPFGKPLLQRKTPGV